MMTTQAPPVTEVTEGEFLTEFARLVGEFRPSREPGFRWPTRYEVNARLAGTAVPLVVVP